MKIEIRSRYDSSVLYSGEFDSLEKALQEANKAGADLRNANLRNADLRNANLWNANLWNADLRDADLRNANLWNADLRNADLRNADLRNADLWNANLWNANLWNADLRDADLRNANLCNANLRDDIVLQFGPLGSRRDYLVVSVCKGKTEARAGCWTGTLEALKKKVKATHGDSVHGQEYRAAIECAEKMIAARAAQTGRKGT